MAASRSVTRWTRPCRARCIAWRVTAPVSERRHQAQMCFASDVAGSASINRRPRARARSRTDRSREPGPWPCSRSAPEGPLGVIAHVQEPREASDQAGQLVAPIRHRVQIPAGPETRLDLGLERDQPAARRIGERDRTGDELPVLVEVVRESGDRPHDAPVLGASRFRDRFAGSALRAPTLERGSA
jgi:hypothetical protein